MRWMLLNIANWMILRLGGRRSIMLNFVIEGGQAKGLGDGALLANNVFKGVPKPGPYEWIDPFA